MITLRCILENLERFNQRGSAQGSIRDPEPRGSPPNHGAGGGGTAESKQQHRLWSRSVLCAAFNAIPFLCGQTLATTPEVPGEKEELIRLRCGPLCQEEALTLPGVRKVMVNSSSFLAVINIYSALVPSALMMRLQQCHHCDCPFSQAESLLLPHYAGLRSTWDTQTPAGMGGGGHGQVGHVEGPLCWLSPLGQVSVRALAATFQDLRPVLKAQYQAWTAAAAAAAAAASTGAAEEEGGAEVEDKKNGDVVAKSSTPQKVVDFLGTLQHPALLSELTRLSKLLKTTATATGARSNNTTKLLLANDGGENREERDGDEDSVVGADVDVLTALAVFSGWERKDGGKKWKTSSSSLSLCHFCRDETDFAGSSSPPSPPAGIKATTTTTFNTNFVEQCIVAGHRWFCPLRCGGSGGKNGSILAGNLKLYIDRLQQLSAEHPIELFNRMSMLRGKRNRDTDHDADIERGSDKDVSTEQEKKKEDSSSAVVLRGKDSVVLFSKWLCWEQEAQEDLGDKSSQAPPSRATLEEFKARRTKLGLGEWSPSPDSSASTSQSAQAKAVMQSQRSFDLMASFPDSKKMASEQSVKALLSDLVKLMQPQAQGQAQPQHNSQQQKTQQQPRAPPPHGGPASIPPINKMQNAPKTVAAGPVAGGRGGAMPALPGPLRGGRGVGQQAAVRGGGVRGGQGTAQQHPQVAQQQAVRPMVGRGGLLAAPVQQQPFPSAGGPSPLGSGLLAAPPSQSAVNSAVSERQKRFQQQQQAQAQANLNDNNNTAPQKQQTAPAPAATKGKRKGGGDPAVAASTGRGGGSAPRGGRGGRGRGAR